MRMEAGLRLRQEMRMKLAPQIIQSIEILQLSLMELRQRIDEELMENVVLETSETETADSESADSPDQAASSDAAPDEPSGSGEAMPDAGVDTAVETPADTDNEAAQYERLDDMANYYDSFAGSRGPRVSSSEPDPKMDAFQNSPAPDISLAEHLRRQIAYLELDEPTRRTAELLIENLDDHGWLSGQLGDILAPVAEEITIDQAQDALAVVQRLEPLGVGARNLQECLLLQLDPRSDDLDLLKTIITEHWDDILHNRYPKVAKALGCTIDVLKGAVETIGTLNPRPGALFAERRIPHVLPDLRVDEIDGEFIIQLEDTWVPSLRVSAYYARRLQRDDLDPDEREYLQKKFQSAQGLVAAIEQRRSTLYNVAAEIVRVQQGFFEKGAMHLKPLKMQEVADKVGVHVSTVSRAIADKYVQTPRGIYSLKHFFTGGVAKDDGDVESWDVVRRKMLEVVEAEDKSSPLSDEAIADEMKKQGIEMARRTVSKYRKMLDIPSSRLRKSF